MPARFRGKITKSAEIDIEEIWTFITEDSPTEARRFILQLETQVETLERFPERCPLIPEDELLGTSYRHLVLGKYRVIFRIAKKIVYVLRVIHGARLLDTSILEKSRGTN
jgi:toxin ParE1/3/4